MALSTKDKRNSKIMQHSGAKSFAKYVKALASELRDPKPDKCSTTDENYQRFLDNEGKLIKKNIEDSGTEWNDYIENSPKFWIQTEENFKACVRSMLQESGFYRRKFEKNEFLSICAKFLAITLYFLKHGGDNILDTFKWNVYQLTVHQLRSTPIYGCSW
ncbi:hypothetical protein TNCT_354551 [Trichonephila clavata]|uniref:Uncharacterized protein n=1 Tax=Trichonephila clavata TaxID=2740835 RepID=A0A8X6HS82_TRICU|nr:hypothetical protein TNCT_354551 [Trichonephila clavata]